MSKYRARKDFITSDDDSNKTLVAWGDKVFIQPAITGKLEVFSFKTRKCIMTLQPDTLIEEYFVSEEAFRDQKKSTGNRRFN